MLDEQTLIPDVPDLPWQLRLGLVFVDEKPTLFGLYRRDDEGTGGRVVAWLMVLPGDQAVLIPVDDQPGRPIVTTLENVQRRWLRMFESELVQVVGPQAQHMV